MRGWPQPWVVACVYWHICVNVCVCVECFGGSWFCVGMLIGNAEGFEWTHEFDEFAVYVPVNDRDWAM